MFSARGHLAVAAIAPALLLPDLVQEQASRLSVQAVPTPAGQGWALGFRSAVHNAGKGPLIVDARRSSRRVEHMAGAQVIRRTRRARPVRRRPALRLRFVLSTDHRHWHVLRFETYELRGVDSPDVRRDQKTGFCLGDRYDANPGPAGPFEAPGFIYTEQCGLDRPELLYLREGISVGFGDDYHGHLEGQSVDVTGLPPGRYDLVHRVNADRALLETGYANNVSCLGLQLTYAEDGTPRFAEGACHVPPTR